MNDKTYSDSPMGKAFTISINLGEAEGEESTMVDNPVVKLAPAERDYVNAMMGIASKYGKLADDDGNGIYVGYVSAAKNTDAKKGVKCSNCAFYCPEMGNCHIIAQKIEPNGYCRLAAIGEGLVTMEEGKK